MYVKYFVLGNLKSVMLKHYLPKKILIALWGRNQLFISGWAIFMSFHSMT